MFRQAGCAIMKTRDAIIEGMARELVASLALPFRAAFPSASPPSGRAKLAHVPAGERVRVMVGRPSLSVIARRLQATAAANGMNAEIHSDLLRSLATYRGL
jgi:hypothetical protein